MSTLQSPDQSGRHVVVIIPAKNEAERIADTVAACRSMPAVSHVVVVDDGSTDATAQCAREAGAEVVAHAHSRGKAAAMMTGAQRAAAWDSSAHPAHALLFIDADLGSSAQACAALMEPVISGQADMSIAAPPPMPGAGGKGRVVRTARAAIEEATGFYAHVPLSGQRCLSRELYTAVSPLAPGWGVEVGLTIDALAAGFRVVEIPCTFTHRVSVNDRAGTLHRAAQLRDVLRALYSRRLRGVRVPPQRRCAQPEPQELGRVYQATRRF